MLSISASVVLKSILLRHLGVAAALRSLVDLMADLGDSKAAGARGQQPPQPRQGVRRSVDTDQAYIEHLLGYVDVSKLKPLKVFAQRTAVRDVSSICLSHIFRLSSSSCITIPMDIFPMGCPIRCSRKTGYRPSRSRTPGLTLVSPGMAISIAVSSTTTPVNLSRVITLSASRIGLFGQDTQSNRNS